MQQDMCDAKIILYKNTDVRSDCNNDKGISLFGIAGKTFERVILPRLQKYPILSSNVDLDLNVQPLALCSFCESCKKMQ